MVKEALGVRGGIYSRTNQGDCQRAIDYHSVPRAEDLELVTPKTGTVLKNYHRIRTVCVCMHIVKPARRKRAAPGTRE